MVYLLMLGLWTEGSYKYIARGASLHSQIRGLSQPLMGLVPLWTRDTKIYVEEGHGGLNHEVHIQSGPQSVMSSSDWYNEISQSPLCFPIPLLQLQYGSKGTL